MRARRSRASWLRICLRTACFCAWTCARCCSCMVRSAWFRWSSSILLRRMASSSLSSISLGPSVLHQFGVLRRQGQENLAGRRVQELPSRPRHAAPLLLGLRDISQLLELLHREADDGARALARVVGGAPLVPSAPPLARPAPPPPPPH